jgi:vacuolar-type H+-ATPase subunit H
MAKVTLISAVKHDGKDYKPGDTFEGDKKIVDELIRAGAAQDPSTVVEQTSAIETAEDEAKTIVAEAQKEADKIKSDAEDEAKTIIGKAEKVAGLKVEEAEKALADATADAEKLVKDAQDAAKKAPDTKTNTPAK